ncbi:hypothetical protein [Micromonospora zamorensis]|uniref:hypothetical protein n=1 Tax=Micromonospora zamorensis TaxID=709883 RepID=UPI0033A6C782
MARGRWRRGEGRHLVHLVVEERGDGVDVHAKAALWADPHRPGHEDVHVVGEGGGVFDTVQVGG